MMESDVLAQIRAQVANVGFAMFRTKGAAAAAALARRLGPVLDVTEVRLGDESTYLSSPGAIPPHTDHPAARQILWYCQRDDGNGAGANLLIDTKSVIQTLAPSIVEQIAQVHLRCPGVRSLAPTGTHRLYRPQGNQVFYAPWLCPKPSGDALAAFEREIKSPVHRRSVLLQAGEALLIDNRRMLHLRDELPATSPRWLTRYWIGDLPTAS
jgi:hypothetical protein